MNTVLSTVVLLGGCYADSHFAITAPVGHGHGAAGADLTIGGGGEAFTPRYRAGGGARLANTNGYIPFGVEGHVAVALDNRPVGVKWRPMIVTHAAVATAYGTNIARREQPDPPSGVIAQSFVGFGFGTTTSQPEYGIPAGHLAIGAMITRFVPYGSSGSFWFVGGGLEFSAGFLQER